MWLVRYRSALGAATWALAAVTVLMVCEVIDTAVTLGLIATGVQASPGAPVEATGIEQAALVPVAFMGTLTLVLLPVAVPVALAWWSYRCRANLAAMPVAPPRWSPGWAACGWFVPIANLFVPYLVLRELWSACGHIRGRWILGLWWAALIGNAAAFWLAGTLLGALPIDSSLSVPVHNVLSLGFGLGSGVAGIVAIHRLTGLLEARRHELLKLGAPDTPPAEPPRWAGSYASVAPSSQLAIAALVLAAAASLALLLVGATALFVLGKPLVDVDRPVFLLWGIAAVLFAFAGLVVAPAAAAAWMHGAYRNLPAIGVGGLTWSPGWAAAAWFVPVANLFVPYLVAREIWRGSAEDRRPLLAPWWASWLVAWALVALSLVVDNLSQAAGDVMLMLAELALAGAAVLFIRLVSQVTRHQASHQLGC